MNGNSHGSTTAAGAARLHDRRRRGRALPAAVAGALLGASTALAGAGVAQAAPAAPDLVVRSVSVAAGTTVQGVPVQGADVRWLVLVQNTGTAPTPAGATIGVGFSVDGRPVTWAATSTLVLQPGQAYPLLATSGPTGSATWRATGGSHVLRAWVDDVDRIRESDETDNVLQQRLDVPVAGVRAPRGTTATVASDQQQYETTHDAAVVVAWRAPAGQPRGTTYTVVEHPEFPRGLACTAPGGDRVRTTVAPRTTARATSMSVRLPQELSVQCGGHSTTADSTFSVVANAPGVAGADSGSSGACSASRATDTQAPTAPRTSWSLRCADGGSVSDATQPTAPVAVVDAGGPGDTGYDRGRVFVADDGLEERYRTTRWGWSRYEVPVPAPGRYLVRLSFVEPTWTRPGQRVFDLRAEGRTVRDRFDVLAAGGRDAVVVVDAYVQVTDGSLTLQARRVVDNPIVSLIEVSPAAPTT